MWPPCFLISALTRLNPVSNKPMGAQRLVYQRGQYVRYRVNKLGRLEHIMTHEAVHGS